MPDASGHRDALQEAFASARARHGDLGVSFASYANRLEAVIGKCSSRLPRPSAQSAVIRSLHTGDLYLAFSCGQQKTLAWDRFTGIYRRYIESVALVACRHRDAACELTANLLADLFLPDRSGESRIASYDGRSSLATWLRVIINRRAANERQRKCNQAECIDLLPEFPDDPEMQRIEAELRTHKYECIARDAMAAACRRLGASERLLLVLRYEQEMQLGQIARQLGVHQSTVKRRIEGIQARLRGDIVNILASKHRLSPAAIDECIAETVANPSNCPLTCLQITGELASAGMPVFAATAGGPAATRLSRSH